jgi:hypothetical protein
MYKENKMRTPQKRASRPMWLCSVHITHETRIQQTWLFEHQEWVYKKIVSSSCHVLLTIMFSQFSKIIKNGMLTVSGLGTVTGTTGRVFQLVLHHISCKSDGCGSTFEGFVLCRFSLNKNTSAFKTQNLPYPFRIYPFTDVQHVYTEHGVVSMLCACLVKESETKLQRIEVVYN